MLFNIHLSGKKIWHFKYNSRFLQILLLLLLVLSTGAAQEKNTQDIIDSSLPKNVLLSDQDITDTINNFRTGTFEEMAQVFKTKMPPAASDKIFREGILQKFPVSMKSLEINDTEIIGNFRTLVDPVLKFYGRDKVYDIIIFRHSIPAVLSDSGVVLAISTGAIERAANDDELLGYITHEIAHEYYAKPSVYTKYVLGLVVTNNFGEQALARKYWESLSLIELQCDAFSVVTLAYLSYNPLAAIEGLERIERDYPKFLTGYHPAVATRRKLVEEILKSKYPVPKSQVSLTLLKLKELIAQSGRTTQ